MTSYTGCSVCPGQNLQNGNPGGHKAFLAKWNWVTSLYFCDVNSQIPRSQSSKKYQRFHSQGQTFQFRALPFHLSTLPMELTVVVKENKLMAQARFTRKAGYILRPVDLSNTKEIACQFVNQLDYKLGPLVSAQHMIHI